MKGVPMPHRRQDNALLLRRVHNAMTKQYDDLREAVGRAEEYRRKLPYRHQLKEFPSLDRDCMLVALYEQFQETGLGGLVLREQSWFPTRLWFENDDAVLLVRRKNGFRSSPTDNTDQPLIENKRRIVLFWEFPNPGADAVTAFSMQLFDGEGNLEEAVELSQRIPLHTPTETITEDKFHPTRADDQGFNFGS